MSFLPYLLSWRSLGEFQLSHTINLRYIYVVNLNFIQLHLGLICRQVNLFSLHMVDVRTRANQIIS